MPAPPLKTEISDTYPNPSNGVARIGFDKLWETLFGSSGLLGSTGNAADARAALKIGPVISYRNLVVNGNLAINQRLAVSGTNATANNQPFLDRWRIVVSGQNATFGTASPDRVVTAPAGGIEQVIEAGWIEGGIYTLSWTGTATATVNGSAITNGGQTAALTANTAVTLKFSGGTVSKVQFELGGGVTPFERRPPGLELQLCQRDFCKSYAQGTSPGTATPVGSDQCCVNVGGGIAGKILFPVTMRVAPTVSLWSNNGVASQWVAFTAGGVATSYAAAASSITERNATVSVTTAASEVLSTGQWTAATGA